MHICQFWRCSWLFTLLNIVANAIPADYRMMRNKSHLQPMPCPWWTRSPSVLSGNTAGLMLECTGARLKAHPLPTHTSPASRLTLQQRFCVSYTHTHSHTPISFICSLWQQTVYSLCLLAGCIIAIDFHSSCSVKYSSVEYFILGVIITWFEI